MMTGPLLGGVLYSFGGFTLPFFVTGMLLIIFLLISSVMIPSTNIQVEWTLTPKLTPRHVSNPISYSDALKDIYILLIGPTVTLALITLTYKEPILQIRLVELGVSPKLAGLFFTLDVLGYILMTWFLGRYKQEERNMPFIMWLSAGLACIGLFLIGSINFISIFGMRNNLYLFIIGILINGCAAALALNNGVAATVDHLRWKFPGAGETVNNITSGIFVFYFSIGEMLGPILGSVLTSSTGSFSGGIAIINAVMALWTLATIYHLGGSLFFSW